MVTTPSTFHRVMQEETAGNEVKLVTKGACILQAGTLFLMILLPVYRFISDQGIIKQESGRGLRAYCPAQGSFVPTDNVSFTKADIQSHDLGRDQRGKGLHNKFSCLEIPVQNIIVCSII